MPVERAPTGSGEEVGEKRKGGTKKTQGKREGALIKVRRSVGGLGTE